MGLDAYLYYQCPYRPEGTIERLTEIQRLVQLLGLMDQHGIPSVTLQVNGLHGVEERTVSRAEAMEGAAQRERLAQACLHCPVGNSRTVPGCNARLAYPVDDVALSLLREVLELNAEDFEPPADGFVRSLLRAGDCDGRRMDRVVRNLGGQPVRSGGPRSGSTSTAGRSTSRRTWSWSICASART